MNYSSDAQKANVQIHYVPITAAPFEDFDRNVQQIISLIFETFRRRPEKLSDGSDKFNLE